MHDPLIGVSTYLESDVRWGVWKHEAAALPAGYHRLVQRAGGCALLLPPYAEGGTEALDATAAQARRIVGSLDGLVLAGGPDVEPVRYGAAPEPDCGPPDRVRDAWELALARAALELHVPLLGICRGMQLLNVLLGGTLVQHMDGHSGAPGVFAAHAVRPVAGTLLGEVLPEPVSVPTYHHQAVARTGHGLVACAYAEDGTVEALELPVGEHPFVLGVQWHPEAGDDLRVMSALVEAARAADRTAAPAAG